MIRLKALTVILASLMALGLWHATPVHSQDLASELRSALAANTQAVETIRSAEVAETPEGTRTLVLQAVSEAQAAKADLQAAAELATTDEQRSRISALIDHLNAAISAGQEAQTASSGTIRSVAEAVRGELVEALTELQPFAPAVPPQQQVPQELPKAGDGWASTDFQMLLVAAGMFLLLIGLRFRYASHPS